MVVVSSVILATSSSRQLGSGPLELCRTLSVVVSVGIG